MTAHWLSLGDAADASCWQPLEDLAVVVALAPDLPPLDPDDFIYCAEVTRENLPPLHVYKHLITQKSVCIDTSGRMWRFAGGVKTKDPIYVEVTDAGEALARAELGRAEVLSARTRRGRRKPSWTPPEVLDFVAPPAPSPEPAAEPAAEPAP